MGEERVLLLVAGGGCKTVPSWHHCLHHSSGALATPPHSLRIELAMGVHLSKGSADARIGQFLEINISEGVANAPLE